MIETPLLKPKILTKVETDFGSTISKGTWKKLLDFQMWMNRALPVGMILSFFSSQTDIVNNPIQAPNPANWQWCDGSPVSNVNSVLFGQNMPNFKEKFLKGFHSGGIDGGSATIDLSHNHGGVTGIATDRANPASEAGSDSRNGSPHTHAISTSLTNPENFVPPYLEVQYFMRTDGGLEYNDPTNPPNLVGEYISEDDLKFGRIYSNDFATSLYNNAIILNSMIPLGMVVPIMTNIVGVPEPDPNMWQECNGNEIINENSPLRTVGEVRNYTPNLIESYIKIPTSFGLSGTEGGINIFKFTHNHTGHTPNHENPTNVDPDHQLGQAAHFHNHPVNNDLSEFNIEPPYQTVKFYIRIQ